MKRQFKSVPIEMSVWRELSQEKLDSGNDIYVLIEKMWRVYKKSPSEQPSVLAHEGDRIARPQLVKQTPSDPAGILTRIVDSGNLRVIDATTTCLGALEGLIDDDAKDSIDQAKGPARPGVPGARIDALRGTVGSIERTVGSKAGTVSPQKAGKKRHKGDRGRSESA